MTSSERGDLPAKPVLFITRRHIGDAVMTTPVLEILHQRYPGTTIDIVAGPLSAVLFEHCPYRGQIWRMAKGAGLADRLRLITALRRRRYELIVDLRTDGFAYLLRARERRTRWGAPDRRARRHDVERQAAIFDPCLPAQALGPPIVWLETQLIDSIDKKLSALAGDRWLALAPGANWGPKCWPPECFAELVAQVAEEFDGVLLLGGPDDVVRAGDLASRLGCASLNLAGKTDLLQAAAVLFRCTAFVGNDSGLGHLASAVGTPTLTVFGPGEPERFHPWGPKADWIVAPERDLTKLSGLAVAERLRVHLARAHIAEPSKWL